MNRVVVFGYSKSGRDLAKELKLLGYDVAILDIDEEAHIRAVKDRYEAYHDSVIDDELLTTIGIGYSVEALFCMSRLNVENLFVTLSARHLSKELKIITVVRNQNDEKRMLLAGANRTLNPYSIGATFVYKLLEKPQLLDVVEEILLSKEGLMLAQIPVPEGSFLDKTRLIDVDLDDYCDVVLLGFLDKNDDEESFIFSSNGLHHTIDVGEILVVIGNEDGISHFKELVKKGEIE